MNAVRYLGQALLYGLFAAAIGYFSTSPGFPQLPPGQALVKLSFSHAGQPVKPCRRRTREELERMPPNMRQPMECVRERSPLEFMLELDGKPLVTERLEPRGLARDGGAGLYRVLKIPAGTHHLRTRLKDSVALTDYNYANETTVDLRAGQVLVIDFDVRRGGFVFRTGA